MDALELLKADHKRMLDLFRAAATADQVRRSELRDAFCRAVHAHSQIEESIFYPIVEEQQNGQLIAMVNESLLEHQHVKALLAELRDCGGNASDAGARIEEVARLLERHIAEEESRMFPLVRQAMPQDELDRIGEELELGKRVAGQTQPKPTGPGDAV